MDIIFSVPSKNVGFAEEARISLITHPYNCTNEIVDAMLKDYFSVARHLHTNDVFQINMIEHSLYHVYSSGLPSDLTLYFTVNSLKSNCNDKHCDIDGCYVVSEVSELVLEAAVHSYIPQTRSETFTEFNHPFAEPTQHLISCITPFTTKGKNNYSLARIEIYRCDMDPLYSFVRYVICRYQIVYKTTISSERTTRFR